MNQKYYLLPWFNRNKTNKVGLHPIWIRVTYGGRRAEVSTGIYIKLKDWKGGENPIKGRRPEIDAKNTAISNIKTDLHTCFSQLIMEGKELSAKAIKERYLGVDSTSKGVIEIFEFHNKRLNDLVLKGDKAKITYSMFEITKNQLQDFILKEHMVNEYPINKVNHKFVADLEFHFRTVLGNSNNTVRKKFQRIGKIFDLAVNNDWLTKSPYKGYRIKEEEKELIYLDEEELKRLIDLEVKTERLSVVRDIFVFCCYTGLAYAEVNRLTNDNITKGIDGELWLSMTRKKTKKNISIPLLEQAISLIEKYKDHPEAVNKGKVFPVKSNQKLNEYLKELTVRADIEKEITTHTARKTFATTVMLLNDVPMETVSEVLGHSDMRITQKAYGKIVDKKVSQDMKQLNLRLKEKSKSDKTNEGK